MISIEIWRGALGPILFQAIAPTPLGGCGPAGSAGQVHSFIHPQHADAVLHYLVHERRTGAVEAHRWFTFGIDPRQSWDLGCDADAESGRVDRVFRANAGAEPWRIPLPDGLRDPVPADLILAVLDRARGALLFDRDLTRDVAVRWRRADGTKAKGVLAPGAVTTLAAEPRAESFAILAAAWA